MPAAAAGILGVMLFWQFACVTTVCWTSFFVAKRQTRISGREMHMYIFAINSTWIVYAAGTVRFRSLDRGR